MLDFDRFQVLTFDCYGTLIDWETGILDVIRPLLAAHGRIIPDVQILELYGEFEAAAESGPYLPYRQVLEEVARAFGRRLGFAPSAQQVRALPGSLKRWLPFPDTVAALRRLRSKYKLVILSNVDDDLFADTARLLQVPFDGVTTAQQAGSYKPSLNNFRLALQRAGVPQDRLLHVGQSLFHDIIPAKTLGIANVWVNRRSSRPDFGATRPANAQPDLEVPDLKTLAALAVPEDERLATELLGSR